MEKSLFQMIEDLVNEEGHIAWKYYPDWHFDLDVETLFSNSGAASFIKEYFSAGSKESPLYLEPLSYEFKHNNNSRDRESNISNNQFSIDGLPNDKAVHTVSAFFLGILIEYAVFGNNHLTASVNGDDGFTFPYLWFLTSLYHDFGYQFEQNNEYYNRIKQCLAENDCYSQHACTTSHALETVFRSLDISFGSAQRFRSNNQDISHAHALYTELLAYAKDTIHHPIRYSNGAVIRNGWYKNNIIPKYFDYRFWDMTVCDHGIIGGSLFLDRIIKNYATTYLRECNRQRRILNLENFYERNSGLHSSKQQLPVFSHISDCIIAHNVYKASADKEAMYRFYGLESLIGNRFTRVSANRDPLLYILSITDTIDPIKAYKNVSAYTPVEILKNLSFEFEPGDKAITVSATDALSIEPIYKSANSLNEWTAATVENRTERSFTLLL